MGLFFSGKNRAGRPLRPNSNFFFKSIAVFLTGGFLLIAQQLHASDAVWLERFDITKGVAPDEKLAIWPQGWEGPNGTEDIPGYGLSKEGENFFLRAKFISGSSGKLIGRRVEWNLASHPWISWKWRVRSWATGSKITDRNKEDSTASVYVTVKSGIRAYVIKYVWAVNDPLGAGYSVGKWNPVGRLVATVVRSGGKLNEWVTEKRNFVEDFKRLYKKDPPSMKGRAIGVLTEGDATGTSPEADYDDFQVLLN